jgi:ATP-dependent Clp protease ATP-binding subunit ClpC
MPTHRYPTVICRDPTGGFHAVVVGDDAVGFGRTAADARDDVREFLAWRHRKRAWLPGPDFADPAMDWRSVTVRPEYKTDDRVHPTESEIVVKVLCVTGTRANGQPTACLPLLNVRFDYPDAGQLADLIRRYALQRLEGLTPEELSWYLPPPHAELAEIVVRGPAVDAARPETAAPPTLSRLAEPVADRVVRQGFARAWGREAELAGLVRKLHGEKANVLLVGEAGVGKTTLLVDAVKEVEKRAAAEDGSKARRFWLTSAGRLVAGMKYLGQWEERVETVIAELGEIGGVLCVESLHGLVRRGGTGPADSIAAFLGPYLARGEVRVAAEASPAELDACRRLLPGLSDLFQVVPVRPFTPAEAVAVVDRQLEAVAAGPGLSVARGTGERIVRLFHRFQPYAALPGPTAGFARELVVALARRNETAVTPADAVARFRNHTGLPELFLRDELTLDRAAVLDWFQSRVLDQPDASAAAADVVTAIKAGVTDPARPSAVLLFCGPTGVGKTELAKALAEYLFGHAADAGHKHGNAARLVRFDMSEFGGFDAVYRLLGPPHGEPGELVRRVRKEPFCVLLLDEIEKASPAVFDTLMGVFDEGRLTDQYGRVTNFRSAVIVLTSNLGAGRTGGLGFGGTTEPKYHDAAKRFFRPEFFNRLDAVVTFDPLSPAAVRRIASRELEAITHRDGLTGRRIEWTDDLVDHLAAVGFDARYGARPLQRAVERDVVAPLAKWLLTNADTTGRGVRVDWTQTGLTVRPEL